eukprot:6482003-Prymnesium_polylepis.1
MAPKKAAAKKEKKAAASADPETLRAAFASFDLDGDGALSSQELAAVLTKQTSSVGGTPFDEAAAKEEADKIVK